MIISHKVMFIYEIKHPSELGKRILFIRAVKKTSVNTKVGLGDPRKKKLNAYCPLSSCCH